ncbi:hypothetical protein N7456_002548 [Penicillium angulare]|uniref:Major facilitator superfamily (MFS) profile domain-containing protein n=1 Tax=Penicillium angulare TaxID=116970 RepID=A0A9W9KP35_9EURO|nr:hypothetical protein N7456_002548 [Penicillium angulare]
MGGRTSTGDLPAVDSTGVELQQVVEYGQKLDTVTQEMADEATEAEHNSSTWQALKMHRAGALWSLFFSLCIIMRAYDIEITGNFYALPAFQKHFGEPSSDGGYQIPAKWQVAMSMGPIVGQVVGAWACAIPMDRIGRKKTLALYLCATIALIFMQVFATNIGILTTSMYLAGLIWGGYHVLAPTYASEVLPLQLRGYFTGYVQLCYTVGQFLQTGITRGFVNRTDKWAYKIPYAIQWVWPVLLLVGLFWAPESPWWLMRQNRLEDAKRSLDQLTTKAIHDRNNNTLAMMVQTDMYEREQELGTTYRDCFTGSNRRRLEICSMLFVVQNFAGNPTGFATYLFEQVGLNAESAFDMGVALNAVSFVGTLLCVFPLAWFGRRITWLIGLSYSVAIMWIVALLCFAKNYKSTPSYSWAQAAMLISLQFVFALTLGPLGFTISSEVPSAKLRARTLSLTATINGLSYLVLDILGPFFLNPGAINAGAKIEFVFGGISVFSLIWSYFRLPETKGRTYRELDIMFDNRIPTRQFKNYNVSDREQDTM